MRNDITIDPTNIKLDWLKNIIDYTQKVLYTNYF